MKNKHIRTLVTQCIEAMRASGYSESCILVHKGQWLNRFLPFAESRGQELFSIGLGQEYLAFILPTMSKSTFDCHRRGINLLDEFMRTGIIRRHIVKKADPHPLAGEIGSHAINYLDWLRSIRRYGEYTISRHRRTVSYLIENLTMKGISSVSDIREEDIVNFVDRNTTAKEERFFHIRQFCSYLYEMKITDKNLGYMLKNTYFHRQEKLPSVYNEEEISKMASSIECGSVAGKRDYAIFMLAARLGLRASDIAALTWENLDWDNNRIVILQHKTHTTVELPILQSVGEAIVIYARDARPKSQYKQVFLTAQAPYKPLQSYNVTGAITRIIRASGVNTKGRHSGAHSLRHSLASNLLDKGIILPVISSVLGHGNTESTMQYLRVDTKNLLQCVLDVPMVNDVFYSQKGGAFYE